MASEHPVEKCQTLEISPLAWFDETCGFARHYTKLRSQLARMTVPQLLELSDYKFGDPQVKRNSEAKLAELQINWLSPWHESKFLLKIRRLRIYGNNKRIYGNNNEPPLPDSDAPFVTL